MATRTNSTQGEESHSPFFYANNWIDRVRSTASNLFPLLNLFIVHFHTDHHVLHVLIFLQKTFCNLYIYVWYVRIPYMHSALLVHDAIFPRYTCRMLLRLWDQAVTKDQDAQKTKQKHWDRALISAITILERYSYVWKPESYMRVCMTHLWNPKKEGEKG